MAPITNLSFQPWTFDRSDETALKDVLARVNLERGHFRDITERSLQEEIAAEGALETSDSDDEEEEDDGDGNVGEEEESTDRSQPRTREELFRMKQQMLEQIGFAHNEIMVALDFMSLLESKESVQGRATMSEFLQSNVPAGTLGLDVWHRMPSDKARQDQDAALAQNIRMDGLQHSADKLLDAAKMLEDNVRSETQYWDQILSITDKGWNVCRLPRQKNRLGVRFGFGESARQFNARGIAALNTGPDGSIKLEHGIGIKPKSLRVCVYRDGNVVGHSYLQPSTDDGETTLEARIRHARDSLYDEELYHEAIRESRHMLSHGVNIRGSTICLPVRDGQGDSKTEVRFDLVTLENEPTAGTKLVSDDDALAQGIAIAARLLLGSAHREKMKIRSAMPQPISDKKQDQPTMLILRPIMSFMLHQTSLQMIKQYLETVSEVLLAAKVGVRSKLPCINPADGNGGRKVEELLSALLSRFTSDAHLDIESPDGSTTIKLDLKVTTDLRQGFGSTFILDIPGQREVRSDTIGDVASVCDASIALFLAQALARTADNDWSCDAREALLSKTIQQDGQIHRAWVTLSREAGTLELGSTKKSVSWRADSMEELSLWDAWKELTQD